jgi:hypothetical protein
MIKAEAIKAMEAGHKVTHRHFTLDEWVTKKGNKYLFEDGCMCTETEFNLHRRGAEWDDGWTIFEG